MPRCPSAKTAGKNLCNRLTAFPGKYHRMGTVREKRRHFQRGTPSGIGAVAGAPRGTPASTSALRPEPQHRETTSVTCVHVNCA